MRNFNSFEVGDTASIQVKVPASAIDDFAALSGDTAPIHMDREFAQAAGFNDRVVHGAYISALVSQFIGMNLPGSGAMLERMDLSFRAPCYAPCKLTIGGRVRQLSEAVSSLVLDITILSEDDQVIASGKTWHKIHAAG